METNFGLETGHHKKEGRVIGVGKGEKEQKRWKEGGRHFFRHTLKGDLWEVVYRYTQITYYVRFVALNVY